MHPPYKLKYYTGWGKIHVTIESKIPVLTPQIDHNAFYIIKIATLISFLANETGARHSMLPCSMLWSSQWLKPASGTQSYCHQTH